MVKEKVEIIQEVEVLKDIVWFLRGYLANNKDECALTDVHINALSNAIKHIYTSGNEEDKTWVN